ncbi:hypothetical protein PTKIN_Ptkin04bG0014900 [Pterospermum kingtungense]
MFRSLQKEQIFLEETVSRKATKPIFPVLEAFHAWTCFLSSIWLWEGSKVQASHEIQAILGWISHVISCSFEKTITYNIIMVILSFYNTEGER